MNNNSVTIGDYVKITTKENEIYEGILTAIGKTYTSEGVQDFFNVSTLEHTTTIYGTKIEVIEIITMLQYLMDEIKRIVDTHEFILEKPEEIGCQAVALIANWTLLSDTEKDIAAEFFVQTKTVKAVLDDAALSKSLYESAKEKIERLKKDVCNLSFYGTYDSDEEDEAYDNI
mgnify:CR=1 FL=1